VLEVTDDKVGDKVLPITNITEEQREQINQQLDSFSKEKSHFDREVLKWDDKSNDIVVLAKEMCMTIMNMTDFMRGRGEFKTTHDIIKAAKNISQNGTRLQKLGKNLSMFFFKKKKKLF
jgi:catenin alpha